MIGRNLWGWWGFLDLAPPSQTRGLDSIVDSKGRWFGPDMVHGHA